MEGAAARLPYVEVHEVTAVEVTPIGQESDWNADGELLPDKRVMCSVHHGALQVFARGVEE